MLRLSRVNGIFEIILHFDQSTCSKLGSIAPFWNSFIEMTQILLDCLTSSRAGDWSLHLQTSERMLVWFWSYDQIVYWQYFSYNWVTQEQLHLIHPTIYREFMKGHFHVNRARGNFNKFATWPSHSTNGQQRGQVIRRNNWNKYIGWSSSKVDTVKSYHCWDYGQSVNKKKCSQRFE